MECGIGWERDLTSGLVYLTYRICTYTYINRYMVYDMYSQTVRYPHVQILV